VLRKVFIWLGCGGLLLFAGLAAGYWHLTHWANSSVSAEHGIRIELAQGDALTHVARRLAALDYLPNNRLFVLLGRFSGADKRLHIGEYELAKHLTPNQILHKLTRGQVVRYAFRIDEGSTVRDLLVKLAQAPNLVHKIHATTASQLQNELSAESEIPSDFVEGMFFPDTYQYVKGHSDQAILLRAYFAMQQEIERVWQQRNENIAIKNPAEMVILASIIEKESGIEADRKLISQVFHTRLEQGMRLQTDPTVIYALGTSFTGNLTRAHLKTISPFNTYKIGGLPPTPIAMPSRASMLAAVQPTTTDFLYFVAKGNGASRFSRTLDEHNKAVRIFQLGHKE